MNFQICVDENWAHRIAENIDFPRQPCTSDFRKMEFFKTVGVKVGHVRISEK